MDGTAAHVFSVFSNVAKLIYFVISEHEILVDWETENTLKIEDTKLFPEFLT